MKILVVLAFMTALYGNDYAEIYQQKCAHCHGAKGELTYLNKVPPIINMDFYARLDALFQYKEGGRNSYRLGGLMAANMKDVRFRYIKGLNDYINTLKTEVVKTCTPPNSQQEAKALKIKVGK